MLLFDDRKLRSAPCLLGIGGGHRPEFPIGALQLVEASSERRRRAAQALFAPVADATAHQRASRRLPQSPGLG